MTRALRVTVVLLVLLAAVVAAAGCSSLSKPELAERLAALPANAPLAQRGVAFSMLHVPRADGERRERVRMAFVELPAAPDADPARLPLVLVHGTPASLYDWDTLVDGLGDGAGGAAAKGLAGERRLLLPELPGHGQTVTDAEPVDFAFCAAALAEFLALHVDGPAHLLGHSYGGEVALRTALAHPERVASLTLVDSAGLSRRDDEWLPEEEAMRELPGASFGWLLNDREKVRGALQVHFSDPVDEHLVEEMFLLLENAANWGAMVDLARDENGDVEGELPSLAVPTLLLWGADDAAYGVERFARRFERLIPDARLELLPGIGHYPQHEAPAALLERLRPWLAARD